MPVPRNSGRDQTIVRGFQEYLVIDSAPVGAKTLEGTLLKDAGSLAIAGTYLCYVDVPGLATVYAEVKPSAVSGSVTPSFYSTYHDGTTARTTASGAAAFVAGTAQSLSIALAGEKRCIFSFTVPGAGSINFATRAEALGL